ncbi:MAG: hypothetical protein AAFY02_00775 [Pseudomonadota bacterium]
MNPNDRQPATKPFSLRLTAEERQELERRAAGMPVGTFARKVLLESDQRARQRRGRFPVKDRQALAQVLARLGQSQLAQSLNDISRAAALGALPLTPETDALLAQAARDIAAIKALLMTALGIRET